MLEAMDGILLVDKPKGWTSFDVVNKVRHTVQASGLSTSAKKRFPVGHTGTLDPLATGLLVLLLGDYTKRAPGLTKVDKTYDVTMKLGETSTTGDEEGEKSSVSARKPSPDEAKDAIKFFVDNDYHQIPPAFSAVKVNGQRAYKLARAGKEVSLEPRLVKIYEVTDISYDYPVVKFSVKVSSGTYVRSLVKHIGERLGTGAYMTDLRRTQVGKFILKDALDLASLGAETIQKELRQDD